MVPVSFSFGSRPRRPATGTQGQPIELRANFFEVTAIPTADIHMYNVQITPAVPKSINFLVMSRLQEHHPTMLAGKKALAFDGEATMYYPEKLPWLVQTAVVRVPERKQQFTVKIEHVALVSMERLHEFVSGLELEAPQDCIHALDVICRSLPIQRYTTLGSSFFSGRNVAPLDAGSEIWFGYHQSLRPAHGRLLVNIDVAASVFHRAQPILALVQSVIQRGPHGVKPSHREALRSVLIGIKVYVTHQGEMKRKYRIRDLSQNSAEQLKFSIEAESGKRSTNVAQYFQERYKLKLQYPQLPLLVVGSKEKPTYLPMEVCHVIGGERISKKLSPAQTAAMIKKTATKPNIRQDNIAKCFSERAFNQDQAINEFGMKASPEMMKLTGRVLEPPNICYNAQHSKRKTVSPKFGVWQAKDTSYFSSPPVDSWGVVVLEQIEQRARDNDLMRFLSVLKGTAEEHGMKIQRPSIIRHHPVKRQQLCYEDILVKSVQQVENASQSRCQLLLIILPFGDSTAYGEIKRVCDTILDVPSQCMQSKNLQKADAMYCGNLLLKINTRVGGINSVLCANPSQGFLFNKPAIIFGADVTHGAAFSRLPSLAAVVASMDAYPAKYACETRAQKCRQEVIQDLKEMTRILLKRFYIMTRGKKPERILFYRDGVSEGQFEIILSHELKALRDACQELEAGYTPTITFIIVQKRHHARFFVTQLSSEDRSGNTPAGTVVDSKIVHPREFDFYLCSHGGIQGTSRPTHYHVVFDENNFTPDILQNFTYYQCYTYARCTRSVSIPPAVYYAHLAAARARCHTKSDEKEFLSGSGSDAMNASSIPDVLKRNSEQMYWI